MAQESKSVSSEEAPTELCGMKLYAGYGVRGNARTLAKQAATLMGDLGICDAAGTALPTKSGKAVADYLKDTKVRFRPSVPKYSKAHTLWTTHLYQVMLVLRVLAMTVAELANPGSTDPIEWELSATEARDAVASWVLSTASTHRSKCLRSDLLKEKGNLEARRVFGVVQSEDRVCGDTDAERRATRVAADDSGSESDFSDPGPITPYPFGTGVSPQKALAAANSTPAPATGDAVRRNLFGSGGASATGAVPAPPSPRASLSRSGGSHPASGSAEEAVEEHLDAMASLAESYTETRADADAHPMDAERARVLMHMTGLILETNARFMPLVSKVKNGEARKTYIMAHSRLKIPNLKVVGPGSAAPVGTGDGLLRDDSHEAEATGNAGGGRTEARTNLYADCMARPGVSAAEAVRAFESLEPPTVHHRGGGGYGAPSGDKPGVPASDEPVHAGFRCTTVEARDLMDTFMSHGDKIARSGDFSTKTAAVLIDAMSLTKFHQMLLTGQVVILDHDGMAVPSAHFLEDTGEEGVRGAYGAAAGAGFADSDPPSFHHTNPKKLELASHAVHMLRRSGELAPLVARTMSGYCAHIAATPAFMRIGVVQEKELSLFVRGCFTTVNLEKLVSVATTGRLGRIDGGTETIEVVGADGNIRAVPVEVKAEPLKSADDLMARFTLWTMLYERVFGTDTVFDQREFLREIEWHLRHLSPEEVISRFNVARQDVLNLLGEITCPEDAGPERISWFRVYTSNKIEMQHNIKFRGVSHSPSSVFSVSRSSASASRSPARKNASRLDSGLMKLLRDNRGCIAHARGTCTSKNCPYVHDFGKIFGSSSKGADAPGSWRDKKKT